MVKKLDKKKEIYAEWLALKTLGKAGETELRELGYSQFTKKEFCKKNSISINTPKNWEDEPNCDFWDIYHNVVKGKLKVDLPAIIKIMGKKAPQDWYKVMFPKQAKEAFISKHEYTGSVTLEEVKNTLGNAFEPIAPVKEEKKKKKKKKKEDKE